jgi:two-component system, OmpR family, alkaline phosphatase synthesis response regulator PhoP
MFAMHKHAVVADDEFLIARFVEFALRRVGFTMSYAGDGEEAWSLIEQEKPALVITDYRMPRLDGLELADRIHKNAATAHLPVILMSGIAIELSAEALREQFGIRALVRKPFEPSTLARIISQVLEENAAA